MVEGRADEKIDAEAERPLCDPRFQCSKPGIELTTRQGGFVALYRGDSADGDDFMFEFRRPDQSLLTLLRLRKQALEAVAYLAAKELGWFEPKKETQEEAPRG